MPLPPPQGFQLLRHSLPALPNSSHLPSHQGYCGFTTSEQGSPASCPATGSILYRMAPQALPARRSPPGLGPQHHASSCEPGPRSAGPPGLCLCFPRPALPRPLGLSTAVSNPGRPSQEPPTPCTPTPHAQSSHVRQQPHGHPSGVGGTALQLSRLLTHQVSVRMPLPHEAPATPKLSPPTPGCPAHLLGQPEAPWGGLAHRCACSAECQHQMPQTLNLYT